MPSSEFIEFLQRAVARELQVSIQYMWQHVRAIGMESPAIADELKKIAIIEMKHAEEAAERLDYFGVEATTKPDPITVGETLREMIKLDKKAEEEAITLYKQAIKKADEEGDYTTRRLFEKFLEEEEEHDQLFGSLLE
ncbi:MAG: bacterioferritin [Candidatus Heimdallarchaeota archaeon]